MPTIESATRTDTGLASQLRVSLVRLTRRLRNEREPSNELSTAAISVLGVLIREGDLTIGQLAAHERVQPPSMTRTVAALTADGYVQRRASADDGRSVIVALSDKGRDTLLADRRRRDAWLAQQLRTLTPDERDLLRKVVPIIERLANAS
ncbi:MarR family winged helix-turn-helix transcriptional regulator [Nocardioides marmorisolisilvae]|uniref:MarR family winged helix-turn-helix transcriptional regulator n=1 Tax=Nocardioides marmorisolisilvae TaxID=1542737 RepID=UPI001612403B|nr:MarR family transcriptional regulator [Nocardioides marmorisolisilvae]